MRAYWLQLIRKNNCCDSDRVFSFCVRVQVRFLWRNSSRGLKRTRGWWISSNWTSGPVSGSSSSSRRSNPDVTTCRSVHNLPSPFRPSLLYTDASEKVSQQTFIFWWLSKEIIYVLDSDLGDSEIRDRLSSGLGHENMLAKCTMFIFYHMSRVSALKCFFKGNNKRLFSLITWSSSISGTFLQLISYSAYRRVSVHHLWGCNDYLGTSQK